MEIQNLNDEEISEHDALMSEAAAHEKSVDAKYAKQKTDRESGKSKLKVVFVPLNCDCKSSSLIKLPCVNCLPMYGIWVHSPPFFIFILSRDFH